MGHSERYGEETEFSFRPPFFPAYDLENRPPKCSLILLVPSPGNHRLLIIFHWFLPKCFVSFGTVQLSVLHGGKVSLISTLTFWPKGVRSACISAPSGGFSRAFPGFCKLGQRCSNFSNVQTPSARKPFSWTP